MLTRFEPFIDGKSLSSDANTFEPTDPSTGKAYASVVNSRAEEVDAAVQSAHRAQKVWSKLKPVERGRILHGVAVGIRENIDELARLETQDIGQPLRVSVVDAEATARYFEFFSGAVDKMHGETIPLGAEYHSYTERVPFGVIGHILPWNSPLQQAARGIAPSLAVGNSVVVKPASDTPLATLALARIAVEAGLPPGLLNVIPGSGREAGMALIDHPLVRKIAFTGSVETGTTIMRRAADRVIPLTLELGGKSPNIIFEDADIELAIENAWVAFTTKCGQVCTAGSRLLVQKSVHDRIVQGLQRRAEQATLGPGIENPDVGPLTNASQLKSVLEYIEIGKSEGARVVTGGSKASAPELSGGHFVEPTIFADVRNDMRIAQEEIFGPVLCIIPFSTEEEAIEIANDTPFGLAAGVWTNDLSRAHRVAREIEAGQIFVNEYFAGGIETPFGGFKYSGFGREKGLEALKSYSATKTTTMRLR